MCRAKTLIPDNQLDSDVNHAQKDDLLNEPQPTKQIARSSTPLKKRGQKEGEKTNELKPTQHITQPSSSSSSSLLVLSSLSTVNTSQRLQSGNNQFNHSRVIDE